MNFISFLIGIKVKNQNGSTNSEELNKSMQEYGQTFEFRHTIISAML